MGRENFTEVQRDVKGVPVDAFFYKPGDNLVGTITISYNSTLTVKAGFRLHQLLKTQ
jgi:hypothetical protein